MIILILALIIIGFLIFGAIKLLSKKKQEIPPKPPLTLLSGEIMKDSYDIFQKIYRECVTKALTGNSPCENGFTDTIIKISKLEPSTQDMIQEYITKYNSYKSQFPSFAIDDNGNFDYEIIKVKGSDYCETYPDKCL